MADHRATCSLCEACCGAIFQVEGGQLLRVLPDREDSLAKGFICAKGAALPQLDADPDRLQTPLLRRNGRLEPASWDEAFAFVQERVREIRRAHGDSAFATYAGNGSGHSVSMFLYLAEFMGALGSPNVFTAGTIDQVPRQAVSALVYGSPLSVTVPDLDRCRLLWIIGANPAESNGSLIVAPGFLRRMDDIRNAGGRIVVFDPRRTLTARRASEHLAVRPSSDAAFLSAVAHVLMEEGPAPSPALDLCGDLNAIRQLLAPFTPERVAPLCDIPADTIRRLARELRDTPAAAIYGRMGTTTQEFSSLLCWLMDVVNILAGNVDTPGGAMFCAPLYAQDNTSGVAGRGEGITLGRWRSRVSGTPEVMGEMPLGCLPEEIETAGEGQVRALFVVGGNPAVSNPNAARIGAALDRLELLVSVDIYVTETNRRAHVIFPGPSRLAKSNYDIWFYQFAIRHYGRFTSAIRALLPHERSEREVLLRLAAIAKGLDWDVDIDALDEQALAALVATEVARPGSPIAGRDRGEIMRQLAPLSPIERRLDFAFRVGPHGDAFGARDGISLDTLKAHPEGLDLGPLRPRLPGILRTPSGMIELAQPFVADELRRLETWMTVPRPRFTLVGRRQLRSNNSWMHNLPGLAHPTRQCDLVMNEADARALGVGMGDVVRIRSPTGHVEAAVEVSGDIAPGVVSLPHGWGHGSLGTHQAVASARPGVNVNHLTSGTIRDPLTGTVQVNGLPVLVEPIHRKPAVAT